MISFFFSFLSVIYIVIILIIKLLNKLHREEQSFVYLYTFVYLFCTRALSRESFATQPTCFFSCAA